MCLSKPAAACEAGQPHGRHGDVYPLPILWTVPEAARPGQSRKVQQRAHRSRRHVMAAIETVESLNALDTGDFSLKSPWQNFAPNPAQEAMLRRVWDATALSAEGEQLINIEAALQQLLKVDSLYEGTTGGLVSCNSGEKSLPRGQRRPVPLSELLDGGALRELENIETEVLLSPEEYEAVTNCLQRLSCCSAWP